MGHIGSSIVTGQNGVDAIRDVAYVLGENSGDWGTLCSSGQIQKFARYKPVRHTTIDDITDAERQSANNGLQVKYLASATSEAVNIINNPQSAIPDMASMEWGYLPPRPGTDWCRITDFLNNANYQSSGYNHDAKPPVNGFYDITLHQSEFNNGNVTYTPNFKWGPSSYQGAGNTSGIELPINELTENIADGTWRQALLIYFPKNGKFKVAIATSPNAITTAINTANAGNIMIRPAGTGELKALYDEAYASGNKELTAIPVFARNISRPTSATGTQDAWMPQANSKFMTMPMGDKIKIYLSGRFSNVSVTFSSITITYLTASGNSAGKTYTLTPTDASSGTHKTQLADPSTVNATACKIQLSCHISGSMATSDFVSKELVRIGLNGSFIDTFPSEIKKSGTAASKIGPSLSGDYVITATDITPAQKMSKLMNFISSLPRRSSGTADIAIRPTIKLDNSTFLSSNYFIHYG